MLPPNHPERSNGSDSLDLVLATASSRRIELMKKTGLEFKVRIPDVREIIRGAPQDIVIMNSAAKAVAVGMGEGEVIIGADTVVTCCEEVFGKPENPADARKMLLMQLDDTPEVFTGVYLVDADSGRSFHGYEISRVKIEAEGEEMSDYLLSGMWKGKAGGFGIQDRKFLNIVTVCGNEDNVKGLPLTLLERLLSVI